MRARLPQPPTRQPLAIVAIWEIQEMLGLSRQRVDQLTRRAHFPAPAAVLACGRIWHTRQVADWIKIHRPDDEL